MKRQTTGWNPKEGRGGTAKSEEEGQTVEEREDGRCRIDSKSTGRVETRQSPDCRISKGRDLPHLLGCRCCCSSPRSGGERGKQRYEVTLKVGLQFGAGTPRDRAKISRPSRVTCQRDGDGLKCDSLISEKRARAMLYCSLSQAGTVE